MENFNMVSWFEIYVDDMERARGFYETVLKKELSHLPTPEGGNGGEMWAFPMFEKAPNASGALVKQEMMKPGSGGILIYFSCENCAEELGRVEKAGGKVVAPKFAIGDYGFIGLAMDTEGNTVGFHSSK